MADNKTKRKYRTKGQGLSFPYGVPSEKERSRIEEVARLSKQLEYYRGRRSRMGLYKVAAGYRRLGGYGIVLAERVKSEARML